MKRKCAMLLLPLLAALPALAGPDPVIRDAAIGRSASGLSLVAGRRLSTKLGGSVAVVTFAVPLNAVSKGDPAGGEAVKTGASIPAETAFEAIYPNPANPFALIRYAAAEPSRVRLSIYAVNGELVRTLVDDARGTGVHVEHWDGRNRRGEEVSSGLYFVRLEAGVRVFTRKLIVAR